MAKRRNLNLDDYIEETTTNIREDRAMAKSLLIDALHDMKQSDAARRELGPIAAKYIENLQRSNEQTHQSGLSSDDKEQLFDLLNEENSNV